MDELLSREGLEEYLKHHGLPLLDRFGQNFLIDENVLQQIVSAADPDPNMPIIEIGAGLGVLTRALALRRIEIGNDKPPFAPSELRSDKQEPLYAVELDKRMIALLKENISEFSNIQIIHRDILKLYPEAIFNDFNNVIAPSQRLPYDVVGNIPYNITSKLIRHILAWKPKPKSITLLVDAAVAKRITAKPGDLSVLAVSVQVFAEPTIIGPIVLPTSFVPQPKVKSAILRMEIRENPLVPEEMQKKFFSLVKGGFAQKRKTLQNSLHALWRCSGEEAANRLKKAGIDPQRRPQTLSIEEWLKLLEC